MENGKIDYGFDWSIDIEYKVTSKLYCIYAFCGVGPLKKRSYRLWINKLWSDEILAVLCYALTETYNSWMSFTKYRSRQGKISVSGKERNHDQHPQLR